MSRMSEPQPPSVTIRRTIEWIDTDASGHYHFTSAMRLFEAAEGALLEQLGLVHDVYARLPRAHVSVDYRRTLYFRDVVDVTVAVISVGTSSVRYSFGVVRGDDACAEGEVVAVLVDPDGRPSAWPREWAQALSGVSPQA
jgi:acyl-CoA thioester hydrolase